MCEGKGVCVRGINAILVCAQGEYVFREETISESVCLSPDAPVEQSREQITAGGVCAL